MESEKERERGREKEKSQQKNFVEWNKIPFNMSFNMAKSTNIHDPVSTYTKLLKCLVLFKPKKYISFPIVLGDILLAFLLDRAWKTQNDNHINSTKRRRRTKKQNHNDA